MDATTTVFDAHRFSARAPPLVIQSALDSRTFSQPLRRLLKPECSSDRLPLCRERTQDGDRPRDRSERTSVRSTPPGSSPRGCESRSAPCAARFIIQLVGASIQRGRVGGTPQLAGSRDRSCPWPCVQTPISRVKSLSECRAKRTAPNLDLFGTRLAQPSVGAPHDEPSSPPRIHDSRMRMRHWPLSRSGDKP